MTTTKPTIFEQILAAIEAEQIAPMYVANAVGIVCKDRLTIGFCNATTATAVIHRDGIWRVDSIRIYGNYQDASGFHIEDDHAWALDDALSDFCNGVTGARS